MININFNNGTVEDFTIVLSNRSHTHKGQILNVENFTYSANLNSADEISFTVYKEADGISELLWDEIIDLRLVWVKEVNEYFEIYVNLSESSNKVKKVTGISLCEAELSQALLRNTEINTEEDIARDDYVVTKFYNSGNPDGSLLHRILSKVPHYSIGHVDSTLWNLQRTFSIDNKSVYDFLTGECAEQFNCLFQFDSVNRSISVYDLYTVCTDCAHRGEFNDVCPKCGSTNLSYYGKDTTILVSADNLTDEITYETNVDSIKNCFRLEAGDDNMTAAIIGCNPNGSVYLYYFSDEQKRDMPIKLVDKIESYDALVESYSEEYQNLSEELYDCIDKILYYQSEMMPTVEIAEVTASTEAKKLTAENLSPIGLTSVNSYTSTATVNSALKNYAKVFVKTSFVQVEIDTGTFQYVGVDSQGYGYGNWTGRFKITNYSDETDIAYSDTITIKVTADYNYYLTQKVQKNISKNDSDDGSVYDVLSISNLDSFKNALTYYCYNRLESFADAIQGVLNVLIEENQASIDADYYNELYIPYYNKLSACQSEMNVRSATIKQYEDKENSLIKNRNEIQGKLNFENYLGEELYLIFCSYRREDTYKNDNYISDGLNNAEIFEQALDFIENAKQEIVKSGEYQHSISANLYNLLIMKEFAPIVDSFELGNWIRCKVDDSVYRLRLISYEINGNSLSFINTEFSDLTKTANGVSDLKSVIQSAKSMASSYSYIANQASKGDEAQNTLTDFTNNGLNSALIGIKNNDSEETMFDNHGILCRSYDDIEADYSPKQLRITHNILAFTTNNWESSSLAIGEHNYYYYDDNDVLTSATDFGVTAKFLTAGYINGSQIIGGEIYSQNYGQDIGTMFDLNSGKFSLGGGKIKYDGDNLILKGVNLTWEDIDDAPTNISAFNNDAGYQNAIQVTQITKDTVTAPFIKTLNLTVGNEILMGDNATISWSQVTGTDNVALKSNIPTDEYITQITKNTVTTSYVNALNVTASSVAAENITGTTLKGKTIIVGGENNGDGSIIVKDSEGTIICTIGVNGIEVKSKSFVVTDGIDVIKGRYINSEYAPNLTELYGGLQCGAGTSTTSGTGYVGGYGHTRSEDKLTWGVNTGNIDVTNYQTLKLSVYVSIGGSTNLPWPYLRIYCDGVLVYIEDNNNFITSYTENYNTQIDSIDKLLEYDISSYSTIRVECCASADDDDDGWVAVGLTSLYLC